MEVNGLRDCVGMYEIVRKDCIPQRAESVGGFGQESQTPYAGVVRVSVKKGRSDPESSDDM